MKNLAEIAESLSKAEQAQAAAALVLERDKFARKSSLVRRIADTLWETAPERAAMDADEKLEATRKRAMDAVTAFLASQSMKFIAEDGIDEERRQRQDERTRLAGEAAGTAVNLLSLLDSAAQAFVSAATSCRSASSMEAVDAFGGNKFVSAISTVSTGNAKAAVRKANEAYEAFKTACSEEKEKTERVAEPDDMLDFVVDMAFSPMVDVLSIMNMFSLGAAAEKCDVALDKLNRMRPSFEAVACDKAAELERERKELRAIDLPYLMRAAELVPVTLRFALPDFTPGVTGSSTRMGNRPDK